MDQILEARTEAAGLKRMYITLSVSQMFLLYSTFFKEPMGHQKAESTSSFQGTHHPVLLIARSSSKGRQPQVTSSAHLD